MKKPINILLTAILALMLSSPALRGQGDAVCRPDYQRGGPQAASGRRYDTRQGRDALSPQKLTEEQRKAMAERAAQREAEQQKLTEEQKKAMTERARQREAEMQKRAEEQRKAFAEQMKQRQEQMEARRKAIQERLAEAGADTSLRGRDSIFFRYWDDYFRHSRDNSDSTWFYRYWQDFAGRSRDRRAEPPMPPAGMPGRAEPRREYTPESYPYNIRGYGARPGSTWNYSRQVTGATFSNDLTLYAGDEENVSLAISGRCTDGTISIEVISPDGKQLTALELDKTGSLNWRKSLKTAEGKGWKGGKWTFRVKAKNASGNYNVSLTSY